MNLRVDRDVENAPGLRLQQAYAAVRAHSKIITAPLTAEDHGLQSMPDASPTKWHLAHTTWFFETLVLKAFEPSYQPFDPRYHELFNSYYEALGARHPRPQRGVLSRPTLAEVWDYRAHVDTAIERLLCDGAAEIVAAALVLGLHHEQQHQELILTDIKHAFSRNPLQPAYGRAVATRLPDQGPDQVQDQSPTNWIDYPGGLVEIGHRDRSFAFDNETPRHRVWLLPYQLASRPVTCGEYLSFIHAGGYLRPEFWLSDGWSLVQGEGWRSPMYWQLKDYTDSIFTLHGLRPLDLSEPVCHLSYFEAAAYAAWAGARLPTEFEWEAAANDLVPDHRYELARLHPQAAAHNHGLQQMYGEVWEWTQSAYAPYPGFKPLAGVAAEYNGKFMVNQLVLRGGSCVTPPGHLRSTYRNFFPPSARWQFSGLRLARDAA